MFLRFYGLLLRSFWLGGFFDLYLVSFHVPFNLLFGEPFPVVSFLDTLVTFLSETSVEVEVAMLEGDLLSE